MRYVNGEEPLHSKASIYDAMNHQRRLLQDEIRSLSEQTLKSKTKDELVESLADKYSINIPSLDDANLRPAKREVDIDMTRTHQHAFRGGPAIVKGTEITISVPYTGDTEVFRMHASSHTVNYPMAQVNKNALVFSARGSNLDSARVRKDFDEWVAVIKQHLEGMRKELGDFNGGLKAEAASAIGSRLEKFTRDNDLLDGLGFGAPKGS